MSADDDLEWADKEIEKCEDEIADLRRQLTATDKVMLALSALTDPEYKFDCAINAGPERDELQAAFDEWRIK